MKVLILYATNSGSTFLAAQQLQAAAQNGGHEVVVQEISSTQPTDFSQYQLVVMGSPSWDDNGLEGQPLPDFTEFMQNNPSIDFSQVKVAIFGLGDKSYQFFCGAVDHLTKYVTDHGGQPVVEPLRIDRYFNDQAGWNQQATDWMNSVLTAASG